MPGIPTLFRALELTLDELDKQNMHHISDVMRANPGYAHLGVIGASIGDFLPADPPAPGAEPLTNYTRIWKNIFQLLADLEGRKGFISTLTGVRDSLNKLASPVFHIFLHIIRNRNFIKGHSFCFHMPNNTLHFNKVNHACEIIFSTNW